MEYLARYTDKIHNKILGYYQDNTIQNRCSWKFCRVYIAEFLNPENVLPAFTISWELDGNYD